MGSPVLSTNTGDNLCMSRQPDATGGFQLTTYCNGNIEGLHRPESEIRKDDDGRDAAATFVREHPGKEARLWFSRLRYGYENDADGVRAAESYDDDRFLPQWARRTLYTGANVWFIAVGVLALVSLLVVASPAQLRRLAAVPVRSSESGSSRSWSSSVTRASTSPSTLCSRSSPPGCSAVGCGRPEHHADARAAITLDESPQPLPVHGGG